jgi:L-ascorbate metabolism protein UlaG (beta-lactamase superfamily)
MKILIENLGHSTFLVKLGGLEILTDPFLSESAGGIKRVLPPTRSPEELSPDVVLISHAHYDHLDLKTLYRLSGKFEVLTPKNCQKVIKEKKVKELDYFETVEYKGISFTLVPARHNRGRNIVYPDTKVGGFIVEWRGTTIYFAGDTAFSEHLYNLVSSKFKVDIAMLPIGGFLPAIFRRFHQTPEEAVKGFKILRAKVLIPIHFGTWHVIPFYVKKERAVERLLSYSYISQIRNRVSVIYPGKKREIEV